MCLTEFDEKLHDETIRAECAEESAAAIKELNDLIAAKDEMLANKDELIAKQAELIAKLQSELKK